MSRTIRVPARVLFYMSGTGWWVSPDCEGDAFRAEVRDLLSVRANTDGSVTVRNEPRILDLLYQQADYLADVARDDSGWDADARADLNSARALLRRIEKERT